MLIALLILHLLLFVRRKFPPLHPLGLFPIAYLTWFAVGTIDLIDLGDSVWLGVFAPLRLDLTPLVVTGYLTYMVSAWLGPHLRIRVGAPTAQISGNRLALALFLVFCLFVIFYLALVHSIGVPILADHVGVERLAIEGEGKLNVGMLTVAWTFMPLSTYALSTGIFRRSQQFRILLMFLAMVVLMLSMGSRSNLAIPLLACVGVFGLTRKSALSWKRIFVTFGVLFMISSLAGYLRDSTIGSEGFADLIAGGVPPYVLPFVYAYTYIRSTVVVLAGVVEMIPNQVKFQYGDLSFSAFSTLLPGKHYTSDYYFRNLLGWNFDGAGTPATLLGPMYGDLGYLGVFLGVAVVGLLSGWLYTKAIRKAAAHHILIYAWWWQMILFSLFATIIPYMTAIFVPVLMLLVMKFARMKPTFSDGATTRFPLTAR